MLCRQGTDRASRLSRKLLKVLLQVRQEIIKTVVMDPVPGICVAGYPRVSEVRNTSVHVRMLCPTVCPVYQPHGAFDRRPTVLQLFARQAHWDE